MAKAKRKQWNKIEDSLPPCDKVVKVRTGNGDEFAARLVFNNVFTAVYFQLYVQSAFITHWREID